MSWPSGLKIAPFPNRERAVSFWDGREERMELWHFVWMLAAVTGMTAAGLIGNGWALVTGERPNIWMLSDYSVATPFRVIALMTYAPLAILKAGLDYLNQNPIMAVTIIATGLLWSFMQGVFILTTFFGFT
jgi:hypothetical protein